MLPTQVSEEWAPLTEAEVEAVWAEVEADNPGDQSAQHDLALFELGRRRRKALEQSN